MGKKPVSIALIFFFLLFIPLEIAKADTLNLSGQAVILMDAENGQVLYDKNADLPMYPASTTKILTGIIALEKSGINDDVTVSEEAVSVEGTAIGLQKDEKIKMKSLIYAVLLSSANDASVAVAEHIGGSVSGFANLMNKKAKELGAVNSHFVNPHGLPNPNHKSTARDLAVISRYAMENERFREIVATQNIEISREISKEDSPQTWIYNHNKLLTRYEDAIGIKTGYTIAAGHCIVGAAKKGKRELIAVVLDSEANSLYSDAIELLEYGFNQFESRLLVEKNYVVEFSLSDGTQEVKASPERDITYNFPAGTNKNIKLNAVPISGLSAPIEKGDVVGELSIIYSGEEIEKVDLLAQKEVPFNTIYTPWHIIGAIIITFLLIWLIRRKYKRKKRFMFTPKKKNKR